MLQQFSSKYYMLYAKKVLNLVYDQCAYSYQASRILPKESFEYSTDTKPSRLGEAFHADVLEECNQEILVIRENLSSYTSAFIVKNQTKSF